MPPLMETGGRHIQAHAKYDRPVLRHDIWERYVSAAIRTWVKEANMREIGSMEEQTRFYDELTGKPLKEDFVLSARRLEIQYFRDQQISTKVPIY